MRVLILSASTGHGHTSASIALKDEIEIQGGECRIVDCMDHVAPNFRRWFKGGYELLVRKGPWLWGHLYRTSDRKRANYRIQTYLDRRYSKPIDEIIRSYRPDVVLCTHSVAQPRLSALRNELGFLFAVVVTDIHPHRMWLRGSPDLFFCATDDSVRILKERTGLDDANIVCTGIPINSSFRPSLERAEDCAKWNLDPDRRVILLSSGGIGAGPFEEAVRVLFSLDVQLFVLCGQRKVVFERLSVRYAQNRNVRILQQISQSEMGSLMGLATLLIGKSGGLTTFEALACGCPFLVLSPFLIPGQEEDNAMWLAEVGAGIKIVSIEQLQDSVQKLLDYPKVLSNMRGNALKNAKPDAAQTISTELLNRCRSREKLEMPLGQHH